MSSDRARGVRPRIAYVNPALTAGKLSDQLDTWWSTTATMEHLAAADDLDVRVFLRGAPGTADETLERGGVTYVMVADAGRWFGRSIGRGDRLGLRTARVVRRWQPDVVHLNGWVMPARSWWLGRRLPRSTRVVLQHHGEAPASSTRSRFLQRRLARRIDGALFTGADHGMADPWIDAGVISPEVCHEVVETVSSFSRIARDQARSTLGIRAAPMVLWVGRLIDGKDPLTAIDAFDAFRRDRPTAEMWMVFGAGDLLANVLARIGERGLTDAVHLVRSVPHAVMAQWFSAADVLLTTSHREGSGYAVIEALSCGCPVAATDIPSHRALVGAVETRFAPGDANAAMQALVWAIEHDAAPVIDAAAQLRRAYGLGEGPSV